MPLSPERLGAGRAALELLEQWRCANFPDHSADSVWVAFRAKEFRALRFWGFKV